LRFEPAVSPQIALGSVAHIVSDSVDLDGKPRLGAIEIEYTGSDRVLAAKSRQVRRSRAQAAPEAGFGRRKLAPKLAGPGDGAPLRSHQDIP